MIKRLILAVFFVPAILWFTVGWILFSTDVDEPMQRFIDWGQD